MEPKEPSKITEIVDSVQRQVSTNPQSIAAVDGYRQLTYGELDARANQLTHLLREQGVGTDVLVGLCMRRSQEFIIAALAILKAGGAYLPLEPDYPANRLSMLLSESGTKLVLAHSSSAQQVPSGNWRTIVLDAAGTATARYPRTAPNVKVTPESLAYVIFTSGSTGRPKGVEIAHSNLSNLVAWHQHAFSISQKDRATLQASPGFDAAVWEIWPYLAAGASVYVVDEKIRTTPGALRDWMVSVGITVSFLPTTLAEHMLELEWPKQTALRVLLTGADTLHRRPPAGLPFELFNNYGPTECTVVSTSGMIHACDSYGEMPSIGSPIDNAQAYVVDESLQPVPVGTEGELLIGGANVGRGYLNRPDLTAQKFIPDHFTKKENARLYRTGDLVRYLPTGEIAFIGRVDDQIKIRGYRIEPEEITAALNKQLGVETSVVVAKGDGSGGKRLVAYVLAKPGMELKASNLRDALAEQLPDYMVPAAFVRLEGLPFSSSGKVDRAALPMPSSQNTLKEDIYEAPQSEVQERLAAIVATLLSVERVGIDDNFFNLGGHSLLGTQMITRVSDVFGVELSLLSIFDDPTVRGMSAEIERLFLARLGSMSEDEAKRLLASPD